ncbi:MAG: FadR/GntR family transcriptional regulator, partial [Desulfomonilia bacterium]
MKTRRSIKNKLTDDSSSLKTLSKQIADKLIKQILNGTYPAGSKLPTERMLAETFGVARLIIREALKRVETLRLIQIRQGSGAVVQDYLTEGGIDLVDMLLVKDDGKIDKNFLNNLIEFHEFICLYTVKIATQRITIKELQELRRLLKYRAENERNIEKRSQITLQMSELVVKASRNIYIQLLFNSLVRRTVAFEQIMGLPLPPNNTNVQMYMERVVEAME